MLTDRLILLRQQHNLSQEQLSNYLGIHRTTYSHYETGRTDIDNKSLIMLANKYKVSLDYIFGLTDVPFQFSKLTDDEEIYLTKSLELFREVKKQL